MLDEVFYNIPKLILGILKNNKSLSVLHLVSILLVSNTDIFLTLAYFMKERSEIVFIYGASNESSRTTATVSNENERLFRNSEPMNL